MKILLKSSTQEPIVFMLISSSDHITGLTGATPTVTISKNGGGFSTPSGAVSEIGNGWYQIAGNASDTNTFGPLIVHATAAGADPWDDVFEVVAFNHQSSTNLGLSSLPTASPASNGGLPTVNGSNYVTGVANAVSAVVNGWATVDLGIALSNTRILNCTGTLSPTITNQRFSPWYGNAIFNNQLVFYNFASWFIWWDSTNSLWTLSGSVGVRGAACWTNATLTGTWTASGSATGSPVFTSLGISTDPNLPNAKYDSNGNIYSNLQSILGNVVTVDSNNLLSVNAKDIGGQLVESLSIPTAAEIRQEIDNNSTKFAELATTSQLNSAVTDIESAIADQVSSISINVPPAVAIASQDPATIAILRGDTLRVTLPPAGTITSRTNLTITAKQDLNDSDSQAIFQVVEHVGLVRTNGTTPSSSSEASLTVDDDVSGTITLLIHPTVTSTFAIQDLVWDMQVETASGIFSPLSGIATVFADVTRAVT